MWRRRIDCWRRRRWETGGAGAKNSGQDLELYGLRLLEPAQSEGLQGMPGGEGGGCHSEG